MKLAYVLLALSLCAVSCNRVTDEEPATTEVMNADPLLSWNEGEVKQSILDFVQASTSEDSPNFIPVEDRIAVFDNDGTLWSEQPLYFQLFFAIDRLKLLSQENAELLQTQPYKAAIEGDMETLSGFGVKGILEIVMATHADMTHEAFEEVVRAWVDTAQHPQTGKAYIKMVYQPMLELLEYLRQNEFKTYIVSGGGIEFMRPWTAEVYGIPREQVIGSSIKSSFEMRDGKPSLIRLPELDFIDDKEGKPLAINKHIGRKPVFCGGNSDGDLQMMQWTASNRLPSFMLYVHHTDGSREWKYDRESHVGKFDKALDIARENSWTIVDMSRDWHKIYP